MGHNSIKELILSWQKQQIVTATRARTKRKAKAITNKYKTKPATTHKTKVLTSKQTTRQAGNKKASVCSLFCAQNRFWFSARTYIMSSRSRAKQTEQIMSFAEAT